MKKRIQIIKRSLSLFLAVSVLSSGAPVYGAGEFSDGTEAEAFIAGETILSEEQEDLTGETLTDKGQEEFADGQQSDFSDEEAATEGINYIKGRPLTDEEREQELEPFANLTELQEMPRVGSELESGAAMYSHYPEKFDARTKGVITGVKNQHPFGICWAFGMASILETSLLAQNQGSFDLSEEHLAYFFANRENDPLNHTAGDYNYNIQGYHNGGNDTLASIFLTSWSGMTTEKSVPLPTDPNHIEDNSVEIPASKAYETAAYLTDATFSDYSVDRMKQLLYENDSVAIAIRMEDKYYNPDTASYCWPEGGKINHVVTVVGWDDNYQKENFKPECGVKSDGAWIVKNSWGAQWGEEGYFYLSYEDSSISGLVTAKASDRVEYGNNYFYDGSCGLKTTSLKTSQSVANVFKAKAKKGYMETIGEVNVITYSDNAHYTLQIYTDLKNPKDPTSGKPAYEKPVDIFQPIAGVKTIRIPEVNVKYGSMYSAVIKNAGSQPLKFCVEADAEHSGWFVGHADIEKEQGFFGTTTGEWKDFADSGATPRIKVHTKTLDKIPAPVLKASAKGFEGASLTWEKVDGVSGYYLYRSEAGKSKKRIASLSSSKTAYTDDNLKTGIKYTYTLVPYVKLSGKIKKGSSSKAVSVTPVLAKPVFQVKASNSGYNTVTWKKVSGATGYRIYRKTPSGKWKMPASVGSSVTSYKDKNVTPCASFQYTVRGIRKTSSCSYMGKYNTGEVIKAAPARQKVSSVSRSSSGIRIKWKTQRGCDGYKIYRKTKSGSWKAIKTISSGSTSAYLDKTASKGVLYYYSVRAYVKEPYGNVYSKYTASSAVKR